MGKNGSYPGGGGQAMSRGPGGDLAEAEYGEFVRRYSPALFRYCFGRLRDRQLAEDAIQEAFLRVYRGLDDNVPDEPAPWLFAVARRCCLEMQRQRRATVSLSEAPEVAAPEDALDAGEELDALLDKLGDDEKALVYLKHVSGLRCAEIAGIVDRPIGTVTAALSRAYRKLRERHSDDTREG